MVKGKSVKTENILLCRTDRGIGGRQLSDKHTYMSWNTWQVGNDREYCSHRGTTRRDCECLFMRVCACLYVCVCECVCVHVFNCPWTHLCYECMSAFVCVSVGIPCICTPACVVGLELTSQNMPEQSGKMNRVTPKSRRDLLRKVAIPPHNTLRLNRWMNTLNECNLPLGLGHTVSSDTAHLQYCNDYSHSLMAANQYTHVCPVVIFCFLLSSE